MITNQEYTPVSGSVMWFDYVLDCWCYSDPTQRTYSSSLMLATHYWDGNDFVQYEEGSDDNIS
jgi:hypothetical protein